MRFYLFDDRLSFLLHPGRALVSMSSFSSQESVKAYQTTKSPIREHEALYKMYPDIVFYVKSPITAEVSIPDWDGLYVYLVKDIGFSGSVRVKRWIQKHEDDDIFAFFKSSIAMGSWDREAMKRVTGLYELYDAVVHGRRDEAVQGWFKVTQDRSPEQALACLLSFAARAVTKDDSGSSWMTAELAKARRMCDLTKDAFAAVSLMGVVPTNAVGLMVMLNMARGF